MKLYYIKSTVVTVLWHDFDQMQREDEPGIKMLVKINFHELCFKPTSHADFLQWGQSHYYNIIV